MKRYWPLLAFLLLAAVPFVTLSFADDPVPPPPALSAPASPSPFDAAVGFTVAATGGVPPYTCTILSPPSPSGTTVTPITNPPRWWIQVPENTPSDTPVLYVVTDSVGTSYSAVDKVR